MHPATGTFMRGLGRVAWAVLTACWALTPGPVAAQLDPELRVQADAEATPPPEAEGEPAPYVPWFIGGYYRHVWVPTYMTEISFDRAPSITNHGFGLLLTYRSEGGFNLELGGGYTPYEFEGPFLAANGLDEDTEIVTSDLALWHLTASVLWSLEFNEMFAAEIGLGLDFGVLTGDLTRTEAYRDPTTGALAPCTAAGMPGIVGPDGVRYCEDPLTAGATTDPADVDGEQYGVREDRVPPVFGAPILPHLALRFAPHRYVAVKGEFGFGIFQFFVGASLQIGLGLFQADRVAAPEPEPEPEPVGPVRGRVLGRVMEKDSELPVTGATIVPELSGRGSVTTTDDGRFVIADLEPGVLVKLAVQHPDYQPGACEITVPETGGDVAVYCAVVRAVKGGAISGQVKNPEGEGIVGAKVLVLGPQTTELVAGEEGLFAGVDLAPGSYRLQVDADGYLMQIVELEVVTGETATPSVVLVPKGKKQLVEVGQSEIVIRQQINFASGSAEIEASSQELMRQIADVMHRNAHIEQIEIQGHTDSKGSHDYNLRLSQERADSVRDWLIGSGVAPARLVARGYGPDHPLRPNDTAANRAINRRVQFIIREQR